MKAIISDMDGLMIDSEIVTFDGNRVALEKRGYKSSKEFYKTTLGTLRNSLKNYKKSMVMIFLMMKF